MSDIDPLRGPLRIVAMGGGTGLSTLLQGLKHYASPDMPIVSISAIVTVTDDGGSSGRLRRDFSVLPPGDIRSCLVALSEDAALLSRMFQYRFQTGRGLKGHSFGNLFLTALTDLTGDFASAVRLSSEILATRGEIIPSTSENVVLEATLASGRVVLGESNIGKSREPIEWIHILPSKPKPSPESLRAIRDADLITLGPGSLYTSVIPNLLVQGIPNAIVKSRGVRAYISNLMSQPGETVNYSASDHIEAILKHVGISPDRAKRLLDIVLVNTGEISTPLLKRYAQERATPVEVDLASLRAMGLRVVHGDLTERSGKIRHSPLKTGAMIMKLARMGRRRKQLLARASGG